MWKEADFANMGQFKGILTSQKKVVTFFQEIDQPAAQPLLADKPGPSLQ